MKHSTGIAILFFALSSAFSFLSAAPYLDAGDGLIRDSRTGLVWMKCTSGLSGSRCERGTLSTFTWEESLRYCRDLRLAGRQWRLPSVNELKTLIDRNKNLPDAAIDSTYFPETQTSVYWTSTTYSPLTINAWYVGFGGGFGGPYRKTCHYYVRCVSTQ